MSVSKEGGSEIQSISSIISFLKSTFRPADYEKAERMLKSREEGLISEKNALKIELKKSLDELSEMRRNVVEVEEELEIFRTKSSQLTIELEKKNKDFIAISIEQGDLEFRNASLLEELEVYKRRCDGLKQQIGRLEEDRNVVCERESKAEERIVGLSEKLKRIERSEKERYADLQRENKELEFTKSRGEREIELWKKRYKKLETRVSLLEEETLAITQMAQELNGSREAEPGILANENFHVEGADRYESNTSETECGGNDENKACLFPSIFKEKSGSNHETQTPAKAGSTCPQTPVKGRDCSDVADGPPSSTKSRKPLLYVREERKSISSKSDMEYRSGNRKQQEFKQECANEKPCTSKMDAKKPSLRSVVDISDSDSEAEITPRHTAKFRGDCKMAHIPLDNAVEEVTDDEQETTSQKRLRTAHPDGKDDWSNHFPSAKRSRDEAAPKTVKNHNLSSDDEIPIGKLKMKKLQDLADGIHKSMDSQVNDCFMAPAISLEDENVEETAKLRQLLNPLKHCKGENIRAKKTSLNHLENSGTLHESGTPVSWDVRTVNICEYDDSDSGDSSGNSFDASDNDSAISQLLSFIRMNKDKKWRWQYESDMLFSFEEDPELCLRAVCALYRQQTFANNQGFFNYDVQRGRMLAEFLMDGNKAGRMKKSVKDLEMHDPKGLDECRKLAMHHSKQLFNIYKGGQDPFFL